ncbi:MAG: hypothetical protein DRZ76_02840 [Candidatus Nealsonbacteria bacterium]|nr:MAG: hypothetical protein DRZ76_02840 [Candidatus Nealsonbacteria bacterium]
MDLLIILRLAAVIVLAIILLVTLIVLVLRSKEIVKIVKSLTEWLIIKKEMMRWLIKVGELDRVNYVECVLGGNLAVFPLFALAKTLGISFKIHPLSLDLIKNDIDCLWDANFKSKEIRVSVNPKTFEVTPAGPWELRFVMAHEIGHIISPSSRYNPFCYRNKDFIRRSLEKRDRLSCLYQELTADIEAKKILEEVFFASRNSFIKKAIEQEFLRRVEGLKKQYHTICWQEIEEGRCPKKNEIKSLLEEV